MMGSKTEGGASSHLSDLTVQSHRATFLSSLVMESARGEDSPRTAARLMAPDEARVAGQE